jgi:hypothetical protein
MTLQTPSLDLEVTPVKITTKKGQRMVSAWFKAKHDDIYKAYGKPSSTKVKTFYAIVDEMRNANGSSMRITGAGSDQYSCAYKVRDVEGNFYLIYHTACNRFAICLDD